MNYSAKYQLENHGRKFPKNFIWQHVYFTAGVATVFLLFVMIGVKNRSRLDGRVIDSSFDEGFTGLNFVAVTAPLSHSVVNCEMARVIFSSENDSSGPGACRHIWDLADQGISENAVMYLYCYSTMSVI